MAEAGGFQVGAARDVAGTEGVGRAGEKEESKSDEGDGRKFLK